MFEREKLSGNNSNDWFRQLKLVLRVEKKMFVIEHPIPPAPVADSEANVLAEWNALHDVHNEELRSMFEKQAGVKRFDLIQTFHACKQEKGKTVAAYVLQMKGYVDQLERLGYVLPQDIIVGLILNGLTKDFAEFLRNYNMHNMGKTIGELHAMLIEPKNPKPYAKEHPAKDDACHHCKEVGHWKRKCPVYLAELLKKKKQVGSASSSGNGVHAQVEAIGIFDLVLPNGLVICLDNCHYAPFITRGVVSVHRLVENGFVQSFTDYGISVSKNNVFYFNAIPSNGIYEIDMHDLVPNLNSIYNVSTKRAKHNLDSTYLWHCRLAHISKKRIEKLQQEGLLRSTDDESFDQCVSWLSGKMTRKSFPHRPKRATDLLGIIHTDVCGPLRHVSRQGASYFITFTDDYSRYGYIYLLKHKHEVFETFKVFKNEVENQLGKTIKALRSDQGGEYISQEFKDYLKACGISPQHAFSIRFPTKKVDKTPYELWVPKGNNGLLFYFPPENKIVVARHTEFFEKNLITQEISGRAGDLEKIQDEDTSPSEITSEIPMEVEGFEPPQEEVIPIRRSERTHRAPDRLCLNVKVKEHSIGDLNEPASYKDAMLDSESNKWIDAMNTEIQSMIDNMVWVLVDLPPGCKTVGSKWIFKKNTDMDGIVHTYKDRLIAKGYTQLYGVDYEETFSPVAIRAIRILISITAKVYKLQRSIYSLKQASRSWNKRFDEEIKRFGFDQNLDEPCVYQKASGSNVTFLILDRSKRLIGLGQNAYMDKILKRYKMDNSKRVHIPMQERLDLNRTQVRCTRPDVAFAQNITSRFQQNPGECHWTAVKHILKDDTKSQTGYVFILNGGVVDWKSSKQSTTAMSATEAEYITAMEAV
nr:hypothetical protein [Tanacetum cinerariifolium]